MRRGWGLTRARVTQLLDLTLLPVPVQERVLVLEAVDGVEVVTERGLRGVKPMEGQTRSGKEPLEKVQVGSYSSS